MSLSKCAFFLFLIFNFSLLTFHSNAQGVTKFGENTTTSTTFVDKNGRIVSNPALTKYGQPTWVCGSTLAITHTIGTVAPETKSVNYGTVTTDLSGASKCWITQYLGSTNQATSADDASENAAGWYWQSTRKQGYKHDGTSRTPNSTWITSIDDPNDWLATNDPCTIELGTGWRIPAYSEWTNADATGGWNNYTDTYNSVLKLHAAGWLAYQDGALVNRGIKGYFWGSTHYTNTTGWSVLITSIASYMAHYIRSYGFSLRCLKDAPPTAFVCGNTLTINHNSGTIAPETKSINYGTVTTDLSGASKCWITQNLGSSTQATSATDATDASAGWYWQFNRKQGYAVGPTPAWTITSISETSDWLAANDPCTIELGAGWRIPTRTEWTNANVTGGWNNYNDTYNSVLKLHTAGYLYYNTGALTVRGTHGFYWSSVQFDAINGWYLGFTNSYSVVNVSDKAFGCSLRCIADFVCGNTLIINHIGGTVAPETKSVTYGTVTTDLSGSNKCWITQNLGSNNQATSATDATEASAGWYWQFNRKQGYAAGPTLTLGPTPFWTITSITETSDWLAANDPCTIELGAGWRIPTNTEWTDVNATGGWTNYNDTYSSELKLHAAGYLNASNGRLLGRGVYGPYWSGTQNDATTGKLLRFSSDESVMYTDAKAFGFLLRCLKD